MDAESASIVEPWKLETVIARYNGTAFDGGTIDSALLRSHFVQSKGAKHHRMADVAARSLRKGSASAFIQKQRAESNRINDICKS